MALEIIFWISVFLVFYSYAFYPLILKIISAGKKGNEEVYSEEEELPSVTILMSAFNEEDVICPKLKSVFESRYPADKFEVVIGSDASDDDTDRIVAELAEKYPNLIFYPFKQRRGKQNVINELAEKANGEILVLTDANVMFDEMTLYNMLRHFKNPAIGLVDTNMINQGMKKEGISFQEKAYISREVYIKNMEGRLWGAMMGPFGGCYAIRKKDYSPIPPNFLVDDFYINMKIYEKGKMAINDLNARVYEEVPHDIGTEMRRKIRIATGNFQNLKTFFGLLFNKRVGFSFLSHKVLRWFGPFFMIFAFLSNLLLALNSGIYLVLFVLHCMVLAIPLFDFILKKAGIHIRIFRLISHFYAMNLSLLAGFFKFMRPVKSGVWERTKRN